MSRRTLNYPGQLQTLPLFARANSTRTSREAARRAEPGTPTQRDRVLADIRSCKEWGTTHSAIVARMLLPLQSVCARVNELGEMGMVKALAVTRETSAGGQGLVFVATEYVNARELEPWPARRVNWQAMAKQLQAENERLKAELDALRGVKS